MVQLLVKASTNGTKKQPVNLSHSNRLHFAEQPVNVESSKYFILEVLWHLKFFVKTVADLMSTRLGFMLALVLPIHYLSMFCRRHCCNKLKPYCPGAAHKARRIELYTEGLRLLFCAKSAHSRVCLNKFAQFLYFLPY